MSGPRQRQVRLEDKFRLAKGEVYLTGVQALVRLLLQQRAQDRAAGLDTAGFVSGYRGSPLAGLDLALWQAQSELSAADIRFTPGLNEELAATAVWGTQHIGERVASDRQGVFALWYGKQPGVDRCGDVFKHANYDGAGRYGGVLAVAGDDPAAKSSTIPNQSDVAFAAAMMPTLQPATLQEYLDFGLFGYALSRYAGCWIGFKTVSDNVESSAVVTIDPERWRFVSPSDFTMPSEAGPPQGGYDPRRDERRLLEYRLPAVRAFACANRIDRVAIDSTHPRFGIVAAGKSYLDLCQALERLDIGPEEADALGIRVYKPGLTWPLDPQGVSAFAAGLEEVLVVEEKQPVIEAQVARALYNHPDAPHRIVGKEDEAGRRLLSAQGELSPLTVAAVIADRLERMGRAAPSRARLALASKIGASVAALPAPPLARSIFFCAGCPHNSSTRLPAGSRAMAGIGCAAMALWMPDRPTTFATQMGGEGVNWIGQAPFARESHVFQNLGDGTYIHSGLLAIRAAVAAEVNITYKILYNDAVAMTGGQPVEGLPSVAAIARQVEAEGVARLAIVSDAPEKYAAGSRLPVSATIHHRRELEAVQAELRATEGVTVLIYDQTCAAEKRRRRKRGTYSDPDRRLFINHLVCEGCGDCSRASNCVAVVPLDTELGRKRRIDQSSCNKDYSCADGFCPSFVSVSGGHIRKAPRSQAAELAAALARLPVPAVRPTTAPLGLIIAGIGGTGIITLGALIGMAAHLDGKGVTVIDETGIAQKNGAVASHIRIADGQTALNATRIDLGEADLLLACDLVTAASADILLRLAPDRSRAVINTHVVPPAGFVRMPGLDLSPAPLEARIAGLIGEAAMSRLDASSLAATLIGDSIAANLLLLGFALQLGLLPISLDAIETAIRLHGSAVEANLQALGWGRLTAADPGFVTTVAGPALAPPPALLNPEDAQEIADRAVAFLIGYQGRAYAERYRLQVEAAQALEHQRTPGRTGFAAAVARSLFRLMAYKDEYEVARLYGSPEFRESLRRQFVGDLRLTLHLAPPLLSRPDPVTGVAAKRSFGPWVLRLMPLLARARGLRGTWFDPFGYQQDRRQERRLIADHEALIAELGRDLAPANHALACRIISAAEEIRGFGHVKRQSIVAVTAEQARLLKAFRADSAVAVAAA